MDLTPDEMKERMHFIIDHEYDPEKDTVCLIYTKNGKLALEAEMHNLPADVMIGVDVFGESSLTVALNFLLRTAASVCAMSGMDIVHFFFRQVFPFFFAYDRHVQELEEAEVSSYFEDTEEEDFEALSDEEKELVLEDQSIQNLVREELLKGNKEKKCFVKNPVLLKDQ